MVSVRLNQVGHYPKDRRFMADAAELRLPPGNEESAFSSFDAAPGHPSARGIEIRNPRTGNVVRFVFEKKECDAAGDVLAWHFVVHPHTVVEHPKLYGYTLVVLND